MTRDYQPLANLAKFETREFPNSGIRDVAIVGGAGRLGTYLTRSLASRGCGVHVLDAQPPDLLPGVRFTHCDLGSRSGLPAGVFHHADAVVHLAGLHGAHLAADVSRREFWKVNVQGTERVIESASRSGVRRFVFASSTSVYGAGSPPGQAARVLDEDTDLDPEDIYDLTKVAAEHLLEGHPGGLEPVILRFGRFFFPSHAEYHLRKLSTGLDALDACQALLLALTAQGLARSTYCIASDLPLPRGERQHLGIDAHQVLEGALPGIGEIARARGISIPVRVGKSVDTTLARRELGYQPQRALDWVARLWQSPSPTRHPVQRRFRHVLLPAG